MREILLLVVMVSSLPVSASIVVEPIKVQYEVKEEVASDSHLATFVTEAVIQSERQDNVTDGNTLLSDTGITKPVHQVYISVEMLLPYEVGWRPLDTL